MANVLIVAYLLIVLALIAVILLQRSEGGALGIGGGGGGGFMTARGSANPLTRTTAILAALFFATAIGLTVLSELDRGSSSILDRAAQQPNANGETPAAAPTSVLDALNQLNGDTTPATDATTPAPADTTTQQQAPANPDAPDLAVPQTTAPAAPADNATTPAAPSDGTQQQPAPAAGSGATTNQ
jgi:preprotein translocase subunit SecG